MQRVSGNEGNSVFELKKRKLQEMWEDWREPATEVGKGGWKLDVVIENGQGSS